jgi:glutathione synthase/RimK-type ligase-like ATP-grasp enzyme
VQGVYVADLGLPSPVVRRLDGSLDAEASARALATSRRRLVTWNALLERLATRGRVINPPHTHELHGLKPFEVESYRLAGLPVPWTRATSDPAALSSPPSGGPLWVSKGLVGGHGYTEAFVPPSPDEARRLVSENGAVLVQERIEGDCVRAYVLEGRIIGAARIFSREGSETDSRRGETRVDRCELPAEAAEVAVKAAERFGLVFAAVDLMRDEVGRRYVLLEANSSPFFLAFERTTGFGISSHLADALMGRRRH